MYARVTQKYSFLNFFLSSNFWYQSLQRNGLDYCQQKNIDITKYREVFENELYQRVLYAYFGAETLYFPKR